MLLKLNLSAKFFPRSVKKKIWNKEIAAFCHKNMYCNLLIEKCNLQLIIRGKIPD